VALLYLDTSALVKLYVQEAGTARLLELTHPDVGHRLVILALSRIEFRAAIRRRSKLGAIDDEIAQQLIGNFEIHVANLFQVQPLNEKVLGEAIAIVDRHYLRAYDALQLGGCLVLKELAGSTMEVQFICADNVLLDAARSEGLAVVNPAA
jgi:predicted nucleic acid-binding protein